MNNNRHRRTARQWRRLFELHRLSGLSVAAFCGQHGLAVSTFFARRASLLRRHGVREGESAATLCGAKAPPRFVEVKVDNGEVAEEASAQVDGGGDDGSASPSPSFSSSSSSTAAPVTTAASTDADVDAIELLLCGDVVVRVRAGFNASLLRQVVASLRGLR
jgi:hypothetical protein